MTTAETRSAYYNKWDKFTGEAVAAVDKEDEAEKAAAAEALGSHLPRSEAEARDEEARVALKAAKNAWDRRRDEEAQAKMTITTVEDLVVTPETTAGKRVLVLRACEGCTVTLAASLENDNAEKKGTFDSKAPIKVFVEDCARLEVLLDCRLVTSFVEIARSRSVKLRARALLHTVQVDLSQDVQVSFAEWAKAAPDGPRVYHAGVERLRVDAGPDFGALDISGEDHADCDEETRANERQFVTYSYWPRSPALVTERLHRVQGRFVTESERRAAQQAHEARTRDATDAAQTNAPAAVEAERLAGNQAFGNREYHQAAVHYTLALDLLGSGTDQKEVILANRSACFLKTGDLEKALADAHEATQLRPAYCKALFRQGLALHALKRYREALPVLGRARDLEPKNKQILDAIRFAEVRLAQSAR